MTTRRILSGTLLLLLASASLSWSAPSDSRDPAAEVLFEEAVSLAREGMPDKALVTLEESFAAGYPTPCDALGNTALNEILMDPQTRHRVRDMLRKYAKESDITLVSPDEPGEKLRALGHLLDRKTDSPIEGALIYLYQTAEDGVYAPEIPGVAGGNGNPRLFGFLRSGPGGEFAFTTIVPGSYPKSRRARHIHYVIDARGHKTESGEILFDEETRARPRESVSGLPATALPW